MPMYRLLPADNKLELFRSTRFAERHYEADMEVWLEQNLHVLTDGEPLLPIGRQLSNPLSGILDLLALDADGNVVVVELKREKAPRDAIAQTLEYVAWAAGQTAEEIVALGDRYPEPGGTARRWRELFVPEGEEPAAAAAGGFPDGVVLNQRQRAFLVVEGYDERIAAVARYLRGLGMDFNLVVFHYYRIESGEEMLDFETVVGPSGNEVVEPKPGRERPSHKELLAGWPPPLQEAYRQFRQTLMDRANAAQASLQPRPRKSASSFFLQTKDGRLFVCQFGEGKGGTAAVALNKGALGNYLDAEAAIGAIIRELPAAVAVSNKETWVTLWFPAAAEPARQVAELIFRYVVGVVV